MSGAKNIIVGFILAATGAAILANVDLAGGPLKYGVWGLIICGAIVFIGGLYQFMTSGSAGADAVEAYKSDTIARLVMQSTITTALADGPLDDKEVEMIITACEPVVHERLNRNSIHRVAKLVENRSDEVLHEIHSEGRMVNLEARKAIVDACILVLKADDRVDVRQTAAVTAVARQLDFSEGETQALIVDALQQAK